MICVQMLNLKVVRYSLVVKGVFWSLDVAVLKNRYGVTSSRSATDHLKCFMHIASEIFIFQYACVCLCVCTLQFFGTFLQWICFTNKWSSV